MSTTTTERIEPTYQLPVALRKFYAINFLKSSDNVLVADCLICKKPYSGSAKSTSNFVLHLRRAHAAQYKEYEAVKETEKQCHKITIEQRPITTFFKSTENSKFARNHVKQIAMTNRLIETIASDQLSLHIVESESFRALLHEAEPRFVIPSRATLRNNLLPERAASIETKLKREFSDVSCVYLTLDLWTNRRMVSFLGVTAHFIDCSWELKSRVIACDYFPDRHTAVNIAASYEDVVTKFGIRNKVRRVVADNASSIVKAFNVCLPGLYEDSSRRCADDEDMKDLLEEETDLDEALALLPPERNACFAHTLQLCIRDSFKDRSVREHAFATVILKCCNIVSALRRSSVSASFLESKGIALQSANATRWNSQLTMIKSIVKDSDTVNSAIRLLGQSKTIVELKIIEISMLKEVLEVLEPFQDATSQVEGEHTVTLSSIGPVILGLDHSLEGFIGNDPRHCLQLARALQESIKRRLYPFLDKPDILAAAVMDPRFKLSWIPTKEMQDSTVSKITNLIVSDFFETENINVRHSAKLKEPSEENKFSSPCEKRPRLFNFLSTSAISGQEKKTNPVSLVEEELKAYLAESLSPYNSNPLEFWRDEKTFKILRKFSHAILGCCATSAPSERVFSMAGNLYTPERARLGVQTFRSLILLKCNRDL